MDNVPKARLAAACLILCNALAGCKSGQVETIKALGSGTFTNANPNDVDTFFKKGTWPIAWGGPDQLKHVYFDPPNGKDTVGVAWSNYSKNQELIILNTDFYSGTSAPDPQVDGIPSPQFRFISLLSDAAPAPNFLAKTWSGNPQDMPIADILFFDHGACRLGVPWGALAELITAQANGSIWCNIQNNCCGAIPFNLSVACTPQQALFQADFSGALTNYRPGLAMQFDYTCTFVQGVEARPLFSFTLDKSTGLFTVNPVFERVSSGNGTVNATATSTIKSLPQQLVNSAILPGVSTKLPGFVPTVPCDPTVSLSKQQQTCYGLLTKPGPKNGPSILEQSFTGVFAGLGSGESPAEAAADAASAAKGAEPRNFACLPPPQGGPAICQFHPVFSRIFALPEELELVLADTGDQPKIDLARVTQIALNFILTFKANPLLNQLGLKSGPLCGPVTRIASGQIPVFTPSPGSVSGPPPSLNGGPAVCPACPPCN
jgi:hypothetical protein